MALTFVANCAWRYTTQSLKRKALGLPGRTVTWTGRYDTLDAFLALYPLKSVYGTGYITDIDIKDTTPEASVDLIIVDPPDFATYSVKPSTTVKTFTASGTLDGTIIFPDEKAVDITSTEAKRSTSARVHQSTYRYYASQLPLGPRFDTEVTGQNPTILRDSVIVTAHLAAGGDKTATFTFKNAPAEVRAVVKYTTESTNTDFSADPIDGSPWFECTDTVIRGFNE
jgi:hypothetical protein